MKENKLKTLFTLPGKEIYNEMKDMYNTDSFSAHNTFKEWVNQLIDECKFSEARFILELFESIFYSQKLKQI